MNDALSFPVSRKSIRVNTSNVLAPPLSKSYGLERPAVSSRGRLQIGRRTPLSWSPKKYRDCNSSDHDPGQNQ